MVHNTWSVVSSEPWAVESRSLHNFMQQKIHPADNPVQLMEYTDDGDSESELLGPVEESQQVHHPSSELGELSPSCMHTLKR